MAAKKHSVERRRYVRLDDCIGLNLKEISSTDREKVVQAFYQQRQHWGLPNLLQMEREQHRPEFAVLEDEYPNVASYLYYLENQLAKLAHFISAQEFNLTEMGTQKVNLSAQGISLVSSVSYAPGAFLELRILLFPLKIRVLAYGEVISVSRVAGQGYKIRIDFKEIHDQDREILIKHIHQLQLRALQSNQNKI